jgi:hypothetical protein
MNHLRCARRVWLAPLANDALNGQVYRLCRVER